MTDRLARIETANAFLRIISEHGRHFFRFKDRVTRFELDARGRVWLVDKWTQKRIYTHHNGRWRGFTEGGTLRTVVEHLRDYIMGRRPGLPLRSLGPWPEWICYGDPWGYGEDMERVRERCRELAAPRSDVRKETYG